MSVWVVLGWRWYLGAALGVVVLAGAVVLMERGGRPVREESKLGAGGSGSEGEREETKLGWYRNEVRTKDGQAVFPERQLVANWMKDCNQWVNTDKRRIVIFTAFEPDILAVEVERMDSRGTWSMDKIYPIGPHDFRVWGDWRKSAKAEVDVGSYKDYGRPTSLIAHEKECFSKLVGLPGLVLLGEVRGAAPTRYSMVVEKANLKYGGTVTNRADRAVYGTKYLGTVEMSETFWSAASRKWDSWLGVVGVGLAIVTFLYGRARWFVKRARGPVRRIGGVSETTNEHTGKGGDAGKPAS